MEKEEKTLQKNAEDKYDKEEVEEVTEANMSAKLKERLGEKNVDAFLDLKLKMNEAKVQNSKAAVEEEIRENDMNYKKMLKRKEYE